MDTDTCLICANSFTKKTRVKITCPYCSFESCKECCQTYLLNESIPKCMNTECNREWTRHFISASFSGNFIKNEYKKHREEILFNNERALLPATQPIVERELQKRKWQEDMKRIRDEITELNNEYMRLFGLINRNQHNPRETERAVFVRACPDSECRGYLSTQWKCGICEKWTCPECHEIKGLTRDVEHTCNPENVETAKLISQDTKSCPSCRTRIFKIDGCDQMWCTQCHTAFSWRTGRIETTVHNPHYYEWMRRGGNGLQPNENANRCQRVQLINHEFTSDVLRDLRTRILTDKTITLEMQVAIKKKMDHFSNICRAITHIRHVDIPRYNYNHILNNQELRVKYMMNEMDEAKFKCILQQNDKRHQKNREIHNILQMFHDASSDILFRFKGDVERLNIPLNFETLIELTPLIEYTNECFAEISRTYHSVTLYINDNFKLASIS